jgi:hypothetical protein
MHDQNNVFYAVALSIFILITWQYFFATSFLGKPAAPMTSQPGAIASGAGIIRPQTQAIATPAATSHRDAPQWHPDRVMGQFSGAVRQTQGRRLAGG